MRVCDVGPVKPSAMRWSVGSNAWSTEKAPARRLSTELESSMLPVRSSSRTTSTGATGRLPHRPVQAADEMTPELPLFTLTARPNVYGRVTLSLRMIVLQTSVWTATGSQGAQHTTVVHSHCGLFAANDTLHTAGMSLTRGRPAPSTPMRQAYFTEGSGTFPLGMPG